MRLHLEVTCHDKFVHVENSHDLKFTYGKAHLGLDILAQGLVVNFEVVQTHGVECKLVEAQHVIVVQVDTLVVYLFRVEIRQRNFHRQSEVLRD